MSEIDLENQIDDLEVEACEAEDEIRRLNAKLDAATATIQALREALETRKNEAIEQVVELFRSGEVIEDTVRAVIEASSDVSKDADLQREPIASRYTANTVLARLEECLPRHARALAETEGVS